MRELRRIRPPAALFHVRELIAQRRDAALDELGRDGAHEWMLHAGAGAMRQYITSTCPRRHEQQAGDPRGIADRDDYGLCVRSRHGRSKAKRRSCLISSKARWHQASFALDLRDRHGAPPMCRNIRTLFNFEPPATETEIRASALQFVRKLSGFTEPSQVNAAAFNRAVDEVSQAARRLIASLETTRPPRNREIEAMKAKERSRARFG